MEDEQGEAFVSFFVNSTFPNSAISVNKDVSFAARDPVRSELFDAMCSWRFSPSEHGEITTKYIMLVLESLPVLQACVLPAPTIEAARQNCLLLQQFATGNTSPLDYNGLVLLNISLTLRQRDKTWLPQFRWTPGNSSWAATRLRTSCPRPKANQAPLRPLSRAQALRPSAAQAKISHCQSTPNRGC